jgi:putative PIG3 family NAD(P)H quinone oxidoreductase
MKAVAITTFGAPEVLKLVEQPQPSPQRGEVLVRIKATAVNRADLLQRAGKYPAPPDCSQDVPGLEFAGEVAAVGEHASGWKVGDRVFGLAGGGTYAEYLVAHGRALAPIPSNLTFTQAAAVPEAFITAYDAMVTQCGLQAGERVLITAVGSGVGTAAVQIASAIGAVPFGTARTEDKLKQAEALGMVRGFLSGGDATYARHVLDATGGDGVHVVLELVGGRFVAEDLQCATVKGRISIVGLLAGAKMEFDLGTLLAKRLTVRGTTLRRRPLEEKLEAAQLLARHLVPLFADNRLKPIVDKTFPLDQAAQAHAYVEQNKNFGKVVLEL